MCLPGLHFSVSALRSEFPPASEIPGPKTTSVKSDVVSHLTSESLKELPPAAPRAQSGGSLWSEIKLLGARISQNLMALIYTGRLKSTLVESLKEALKEDSINNENLWFKNVYCRRNDLLNIGCSLNTMTDDLKSVSSTKEFSSIQKNYKYFSENLPLQIGNIASDLVSSSIDEYCQAEMNGNALLAHSIFKHMERLFLRIGESDNSLREIANKKLDEITEKFKKGLTKALYRPGNEGAEKIDARLKIMKRKLYGMARPIMDRQESRIISSNVKNMLSSISALKSQLEKGEKGEEGDVESVALPLIRISFLMRSKLDFANFRKEVRSQLASLKPEDKREIENFLPSKSGKPLYSQCSLGDMVKSEIKFETIEKVKHLLPPNETCRVENISKNVSKILNTLSDCNL